MVLWVFEFGDAYYTGEKVNSARGTELKYVLERAKLNYVTKVARIHPKRPV